MNRLEGSADGPWEVPVRLLQGDLFPHPRDKILAWSRVSIDEVERWRARGWISFDVRDVHALDESRVSEICFIRNLVRSELSDAQVAELLSQLDKPYAYAPHRVAYSFARGWVQVPLAPSAEDREAYIERHLPVWIERKASGGELDLLEGIRDRIIMAIAMARAARREREVANDE